MHRVPYVVKLLSVEKYYYMAGSTQTCFDVTAMKLIRCFRTFVSTRLLIAADRDYRVYFKCILFFIF